METTRNNYRVQHLLVHSSPKEVENSDGSKRLVYCSMVFRDDLPALQDARVKNVINLSKKQVLHLARLSHIDTKNEIGAMNKLSILVGSNESQAVVSSTFKKKGDKYVDSNDTEQVYTKDWYDNRIDSLMLHRDTEKALKARVIEDIYGSWEKSDIFGDDDETKADPKL